jgi:putative ATPase
MENPLLAECPLPGKRRLELLRGDLTLQAVDAIVNAANASLSHGGGVAAAIVRRGGEVIQQESDRWTRVNGLASHTRAAVTGAGRLPCRYVIHAVGPVWGEGDEDRKLAQAVESALAAAGDLRLESLALPPISTGIFGFPKERAAPIFFETIRGYLAANPDTPLRLVRIVIIDQPTADAFLSAFEVWRKDNPAA